MVSFQDNLDDELKKRQKGKKTNASNTADKNAKDKTNVVYKKFSFKSFFIAFTVFSLSLLSLLGWAWTKAEKTTTTLVKNIPSKTAIVQTVDSDIALNQPVLTMPSAEKSRKQEDVTAKTPVANTKEDKASPTVTTNLGDKPYQANSRAFTPSSNKPLLSFVIYDMGLSQKRTKNLIENLPQEISLAFSPYAQNTATLTNLAISDGHEVWLSLPLESKEYPLNDTGPSTLLVNASTEKNQVRLNNIMSATTNNAGFITPPHHIFKTEDANVNPVIKEIFNRGYAMIDSNVSNQSFISRLANMKDFPYAQGHIWLDDEITALSINQNIRKIINYGTNKNNVIVMLHPYPASIKAVQKLLNSKAMSNFELAPVSAQLKNNK